MPPNRPVPPSAEQAALIWQAGLSPAYWLVRMEDRLYLHLVGINREVVIIDRITGEAVKRP